MKTLVYIVVLLTGISSVAIAQPVLLEQNWQSEEDFHKTEKNVIEYILWLEENPLATATNDTKGMTEYVLNWLSMCPYMSVTYDEIYLEGLTNTKKYKFGEKFRVSYLFGKSIYILSFPDKPDEALACARGIEGMVKVYQELKPVDPSVKHKTLEKYSRLYRSGKLIAFTKNSLPAD